MILMVDSWLKALNAGKLVHVGCVMVDFRKVFDLVDHQIILKNYSQINVVIAVYTGLNHICLTEVSALL